MTTPREPTDAEYQAAIMNAAGPKELAAAMWDYYHDGRDGARANRAPRELLYLHMGMLIGALMRVLDAPTDDPNATALASLTAFQRAARKAGVLPKKPGRQSRSNHDRRKTR